MKWWAVFDLIEPMDEVIGILVAVGALIAGLLVLGWAYGDFSSR